MGSLLGRKDVDRSTVAPIVDIVKDLMIYLLTIREVD
jgi:hypothetical protein